MYDSIYKLIEAGLLRDSGSVRRYAEAFENELVENGKVRESSKVHSILQKRQSGRIVADSLVAMPVDAESNLAILDIEPAPSFNELILQDSVKAVLDDFIDGARKKHSLMEAGIPMNMALLLYGPPGCGKTSIAAYMASELGIPLATARLDGIVSSKLGSTAKNLRKIFDYAENHECILFLDELDAVAKTRDDGYELGELKRVVNSLLLNMDEYCRNGILVAATNHEELLDRAVWRRFQTVMEIEGPGVMEIDRYCSVLLKDMDMSLFRGKDMSRIVDAMAGLSYADIETVLQNVIRHMVMQNRRSVIPLEIASELIRFRHHSNIGKEDVIREMLGMGYSQRAVASYLNISTRQVRNCIEK